MRNGMIEYPNGSRYWYQCDQLHRPDGPACEYANGDREWYQYNLRHREDGPAIEHADGYRKWFLNGKKYTEEEFEQELLVRKWGLSVDV